MNQVLLEDEDRNEPRGLLSDIQGERVPDKKFPILCPLFPPCSPLREPVKKQVVARLPL